MTAVSLSVMKQHLRSDRDDENDYLLMLHDAAVSHFQDFTGLDSLPSSPAVRQGLLLLIGHWYENREMATERALSEAPAATYALWAPYRRYDLGDDE